jgi:hypothetical protein
VVAEVGDPGFSAIFGGGGVEVAVELEEEGGLVGRFGRRGAARRDNWDSQGEEKERKPG